LARFVELAAAGSHYRRKPLKIGGFYILSETWAPPPLVGDQAQA
jgi:hypothetical protein